jgi:uncharacterized protein (TIGR03086 family)
MPADLRPGPDSPPTDELHSAEWALGVVQQALHPVSRDDLSLPTPCGDFDVAQLTDHLVDTITSIGAAVGADSAQPGADDSVERRIVTAGRATLDALHRHGLDGTATWHGDEWPVKTLAGVLSFGLLVHGWDFAAATGHPIKVPDSLADYVFGLAEELLTPQRRANGEFAAPVEPPDGADGVERLVAFSGRNPRPDAH